MRREVSDTRAYLSARKANMAESIPPEKRTATLASPRCFLGKIENGYLDEWMASRTSGK